MLFYFCYLRDPRTSRASQRISPTFVCMHAYSPSHLYLVRRNRTIFCDACGHHTAVSTILITSHFWHSCSCYFIFAFLLRGNRNRQIRRERSRSRSRRQQGKWKEGCPIETLTSSSCLSSFESYQYFSSINSCISELIRRWRDVVSVCCIDWCWVLVFWLTWGTCDATMCYICRTCVVFSIINHCRHGWCGRLAHGIR